MINPFITSGYVDSDHFCDRVNETNEIISLLTNGNNIALISPRRYGKTDLIRHCFDNHQLLNDYYAFIVDIYSTRSLPELVNKLGSSILNSLKPKGKKVFEKFINTISSLKAGITYDIQGNPSWTIRIGDIQTPNTTLDEIFHYLKNADKPCLVAIDEFQQITKYQDTSVEAVLRTYIQQCQNAHFIFSGSQRHIMGTMFSSPARPFYQSVSIINLNPIEKSKYTDFCQYHFQKGNKNIDTIVISTLYDQFEGITFYLQKVMNVLYMQTETGQTCTKEMLQNAIDYIINFSSNTYEDLIYQLPEKQRNVLFAISHCIKASNITSGNFVKQNSLISPSSVSSAVKGLLEKDLITFDKGIYQVYDKFLDNWIRKTQK